MSLSDLSVLNSLGAYPDMNNQPSATRVSQFEASFEKTFIDITTNEGDTVTLQRSSSHEAFSQYNQWQDASSQGMSFHGQVLDTHSFSYSVEGDLNEEELQDLGNLFDTLSVIADDFFQGNFDEAIAGALQIGDMGSISSLSATFSRSETTATQITTQHPYATADAKHAISEENALNNKRQAQWKQILSYLEKRKEELEQLEKVDLAKIKDHRQEMMERITETLENHPRLSHHIQKLAEKAIAEQEQKNLENKHDLKDGEDSSPKKHGHEYYKDLPKSLRT